MVQNDFSFQRAAVLGGGSYGTALAQLLGRKGVHVSMQVREEANRRAINEKHINESYLPGFVLSEHVKAVATVQEAVADADLILLVIPTAFFRGASARCWLHSFCHARWTHSRCFGVLCVDALCKLIIQCCHLPRFCENQPGLPSRRCSNRGLR